MKINSVVMGILKAFLFIGFLPLILVGLFYAFIFYGGIVHLSDYMKKKN